MITSMMPMLTDVWDFSAYWANLVEIGVVCLILLLSNALRRKVKWIRNSLMPTAIIGGFVGLGLKYLLSGLADWTGISAFAIITNQFMGLITYHALAIGFIAITLKEVERNKETGKANGKPIKSGLFIVCNYILQGIIGLAITIPLAYLLTDVAPFAGILLPMGYGQGPGQALNIGTIFETAGGFIGGSSFGLMISTMGFVSASVGGVIYLNRMVRKGKLKRVNNEGMSESREGYVESANEIPLVESIDKLTIQVALVAISYLFTWIVLSGISALIDLTGPDGFLVKSIKPLLWGFNFIFAIVVTMIVKQVIKGLKKKKLMIRTYTNNYMLNRISGVAFDLMIICSIMAIDVKMIAQPGMIIALVLMCVLGAVATFFYDRYVAYRVYKGYEEEAFLGFYGTMTGTASTGIALLREIDPEFKTPAANELVIGSSTAILFGGPLLVITGIIYNTGWYWVYGSLALLIIMFLVMHFFLMKKPRSEKKI